MKRNKKKFPQSVIARARTFFLLHSWFTVFLRTLIFRWYQWSYDWVSLLCWWIWHFVSFQCTLWFRFFKKGQLIRFRIYSPFITWIIYENNLIKTSVQRIYKSDELLCSLIPPTLSHTTIFQSLCRSENDDIIWSLKLEKQGQQAIFIVKAFRMWSIFKLSSFGIERN